MNETVDFNTYVPVPYFLIAAYYMIMLRIWLPPPPPSDGHEKAGGEKTAVGPEGKSTQAIFQRVTPSANENADQDRTAEALAALQPLDAIERIHAADEDFDEKSFLSGASQAYELVVNAHAKGDTAALDTLLSPEVARTFADAINERREKGESLTLDFIGIKTLEIVNVWLDEDMAEIAVRFVSELIKVTRAVDNAVVDGDPEKVVEAADLWTFARYVPSADPHWRIVATEGG